MSVFKNHGNALDKRILDDATDTEHDILLLDCEQLFSRVYLLLVEMEAFGDLGVNTVQSTCYNLLHLELGDGGGCATRSLVRFQIVSLEFFIDIILPIALWPCGRLSL